MLVTYNYRARGITTLRVKWIQHLLCPLASGHTGRNLFMEAQNVTVCGTWVRQALWMSVVVSELVSSTFVTIISTVHVYSTWRGVLRRQNSPQVGGKPLFSMDVFKKLNWVITLYFLICLSLTFYIRLKFIANLICLSVTVLRLSQRPHTWQALSHWVISTSLASCLSLLLKFCTYSVSS